jgi:hypothetical protein
MARSSALVLLLLAACSTEPAVVGVLGDQAFELSRGDAALRGNSERPSLIQDETVDQELRTINLSLPATFEVGESLPMGVGRGADAYLYVAAGELVEFKRGDGVTVRTTAEGARTASSLAGELIIDEWSSTAKSGHFDVELTDGGQLTGAFFIIE